MKVSCLRKDLRRGLEVVVRAIPRRSAVGVLSNVMLEAQADGMVLSTTNLMIAIRCRVSGEIQREGVITVPGRFLLKIVKSLSCESICMEAGDGVLKLRWSDCEVSIKGINAEEFPIIPRIPDEPRAEVDAQELARMIRQVVFAAFTDESHPIISISGVLVQLKGRKCTMVAADGFRFSVSSTELSKSVKEPMNLIIPARALSELARISSKERGLVSLFLIPDYDQVCFRIGHAEVISQILEGYFPDYRDFLPKAKKGQTVTIVDTHNFLAATKTVVLVADVVYLHILPDSTGGSIEISATTEELGSITSRITGQVEGDEMKIAFNGKFLIEVLSVIEAEKVELATTSRLSGSLIRPIGTENFIHVLMPMSVRL